MYQKLVDLTGVTPDKHSPLFDVKVTVGYWRKANAIHAWFVRNVQGGKDDCRGSYVSREQLIQLKEACFQVLDKSQTKDGKLDAGTTYHGDGMVEHHQKDGQVIANPEVAKDLLPNQDGFFFGNTDYDERYLDNLRNTIAIIDRALALPDCWNFEYRSSW
jgi:hypothetical protein